jgi:membrane protein EpsK
MGMPTKHETEISVKNVLNTPSLAFAQRRFVPNVISNGVYIGAQVVVTFWMTPYLIGYLGMAAYGIIPLTQNLVSYTAVLTNALNNAVSRYLTIELGQRQIITAKKTFNSALFAILGLFLLLSPVILIIAFAFPNIFSIPTGFEKDASWLFILIAVTFFSSVVGGVFSVSAFVYSEFLKLNLVNIVSLLSRVCCLIILFSFFSPRIWYAGIGMLVSGLISLFGYLVLWNKLTPELKVEKSAVELNKLKEQMEMGVWVVVNTAGAMLLSRVDLIIVNGFYGAVLTGGYATVAQFTMLMEYLVTAIGNVMRPIILVKYANSDFQGLKRLCIQSVKILGYVLALPIGLLCGFSKPFLTLWLGASYHYLSTLMIAILIHQAMNYSVRPMLYIHTAYNKVRWPGIVTLLCGIASLGMGIVFATWNYWGAVGVALAVAFAWTMKNAIYMPIYTAHIMGLKRWSFVPSITPSIIGTLVVGILSYCITLIQTNITWLTLAGSFFIVSLVYGVAVWMIGLNHEDKQLFIAFFPFLDTNKKYLGIE